MLQESLNIVPQRDEKVACAWSLRDHAEITWAPFLDLTSADDQEAGPSRVKDEEEEQEADGGAAVKDEPLDFTVFDRCRCYR